MKTYPINLVLEDKLVILVGAKGEIVHKIPGLLEVGARVRVIAPSAAPEVEAHARAGEIEWLRRRYRPGDLTGATVVFAATNDPAVHDLIWAEGAANNQLVNVMDVLDRCNFHAVSTFRRGLLTVAIGTGGAAPALAVTLRRRLEAEIGPEYGEFLERAQTLRPIVQRRVHPFRRRVEFWYALVESPALAALRAGDSEAFQRIVDTLLAQYSTFPPRPASHAFSLELVA
ncbi:bifunctional precorrin-2 dehydrogenase/sirohydrochlorin ferrochelatase [Caldilinea sp.]|jgi:precorrin-2 dehydrogenase/sirohydrochlorin ferrochelatase|uniref:precorrin-2 dehydrogenase/sirohydrochlorin ferrochelatase family protein n=1 Tax=Caldilinea sp. TaxID=2293560 RepID=UPI001B25DF8B|nr:bifunctional precorrin-2 dehydrogenase/sirohydrochlorin ferrochelatase [Caldilinea sp.]MBO9394857.1 bifunctional precorrin-2 dehydrogenase/sirohydrochlorin ferrochelatase [Caldilinea sp.]